MSTETPLRGLRTVRVDKDALIEVVQKNRDEHRAIFEEALEGWQKEVIKELESAVADAKKGIYRVRFNLPRPEDHTSDYDRALLMLAMSLDDELELTMQEFEQYVRDEWGWQREFLTTSSAYSAMARDKGEDI